VTSRRRPAPRWVRYGQGLALVFEFVGVIGGGAVVGWLADSYLHTGPIFLIFGTLVAVSGAFVRLVQSVRRLESGGGRGARERETDPADGT
jgi:F0F1-type ATP synthase assembly protein I